MRRVNAACLQPAHARQVAMVKDVENVCERANVWRRQCGADGRGSTSQSALLPSSIPPPASAAFAVSVPEIAHDALQSQRQATTCLSRAMLPLPLRPLPLGFSRASGTSMAPCALSVSGTGMGRQGGAHRLIAGMGIGRLCGKA
eukprot:3409258-Rhodomonas_salina.1